MVKVQIILRKKVLRLNMGDSSIHSKSDSQNHDSPAYRVFLLGSFCTLTLNPSSDIIAGRAACMGILHPQHSLAASAECERERKKLHETFSSISIAPNARILERHRCAPASPSLGLRETKIQSGRACFYLLYVRDCLLRNMTRQTNQ
jgi:hypothetical protein